jgi:hypothetical protein
VAPRHRNPTRIRGAARSVGLRPPGQIVSSGSRRSALPFAVIPQLGHDYFELMGAGLVIAFAVIAVTLPLLRRMTLPGNVRFE